MVSETRQPMDRAAFVREHFSRDKASTDRDVEQHREHYESEKTSEVGKLIREMENIEQEITRLRKRVLDCKRQVEFFCGREAELLRVAEQSFWEKLILAAGGAKKKNRLRAKTRDREMILDITQSQIAGSKRMAEESKEEIERLFKKVSEARRLFNERTDLIRQTFEQVLDDLIKAFDEKIDKEMAAYERSENRDVAHLMAERNIFFTHGIASTIFDSQISGSENSFLRRGTDFATKAMIILAFNPEISTFPHKQQSVDDDRSFTHPFAHSGFILRRGEITSVGSSATYFDKPMGKRQNWTQTNDISFDRMNRDLPGDSNPREQLEVVVTAPKIAGLFITGNPDGLDETIKFARDFSIPLFFLDLYNGKIYLIPKEDMDTNRLIKSERIDPDRWQELTPQDLANSQYDISEEDRKRMISHIVEVQPFKEPFVPDTNTDIQ